MTDMTKVMAYVRFDVCFDIQVEVNRLSVMSVLTCLTKLTAMREHIANLKAINKIYTFFASARGYYNLQYC